MLSSDNDNRFKAIRGGKSPSVPPQAVEAEERILGGILLDPNAIERVAETLRPEMFYVSAHAEIYRAAIALHQRQQPTDFITVAAELRGRKKLDEVGGQSKLIDLIEETVSAANIDSYAELLAEKWQRRQLFKAGQALCEQAYDEEIPLAEVTDAAEASISKISGCASLEVETLDEIVCKEFAEIERRSVEKIPPGILSGFYDLDAMTQGFQPGDLVIVAGRPSMGKTAFTLTSLMNACKASQKTGVFFSLEMNKGLLVRRLISAESRIESGRLKSGSLHANDWEPLGHAVARLAQIGLRIDDTPNISIGEVRSKLRKLASKTEIGIAAIDYLQIMGDGGDNRVQELAKITRALKGLGRELNVTVIALSQLSRSCEQRTNKRPMMSDLRESGSIEQDADLVMMLYRDEYYNPDSPDRGIAEVILTKHRNGPTGVVKMLFESQFTQFRNLARGGF